MKTLSYFNFIWAAAFVAFFCYQAVYAVVRLLGKGRKFKA